MASADIPSKKVSVQCKIPDGDQFSFDIEKSQLESLLSILVDCKYKRSGCRTNDYARDIKDHESRCLYRTIVCPIDGEHSVSAENFVEHVTENHRSECISTEENVFIVPIDLDGNVQVNKLVQIQEDVIFLQLRSDKDGTTLHAALDFIRNSNLQLNCKITIMADSVKWSKQKLVLAKTDLGFTIDDAPSVTFDLRQLKEVRKTFKCIGVRVEVKSDPLGNVKDNDFLETITCRSCGDILTSFYFQCQRQHMACATCFKLHECTYQLSEDCGHLCSFCPVAFQYDSDHFDILKLSSVDSFKKYEFPCKNQPQGCKQYIRRFTSKHELMCKFNVFKCPVRSHESNFSGNFSELVLHITKHHDDRIMRTNTCLLNKKYTQHFIFAFGSLFFVHNLRNCCTISWLATSDLTHNFTFEVTFLTTYGERITISTSTAPGSSNYRREYWKSVYNTIDKKAQFKIYNSLAKYNEIVDISVVIRKQA